MTISTTKDVLFTAFFMLMSVCVGYWTTGSKICAARHWNVFYIFSVVGVILFRNNGIYGVVLILMIGGIYMYRHGNKRFVRNTVYGVLIGVAAFYGLKFLTNAQQGITKNVYLSVPYQQMAYVYSVKNDELLQADQSDIRDIIPEVDNYNPNYADRILFSAKAFESGEQMDKFINTYIRLGIRYPSLYIEAFAYQNLGYLYIFDRKSPDVQEASGGNRWGGLLETELRDDQVVHLEHVSYIPFLEKLFEELFTYNKYQRVLPLWMICSLGFYFWLMVLSGFLSLNFKCSQLIVIGANLLGFLITMLLGPMVTIRYGLPYVMVIPVIYGCILLIASKKEMIAER